MYKVVLIPGDGIGPEVAEATRKIVGATGVEIDWLVVEAGTAVLDKTGELIPQSVFDAIEAHRVVLKGPITTPIGGGFKSINVLLRQKYELYANMRPVTSYPEIGKYSEVDLVIFRENTEDLYAGREVRVSEDEVHGIKVITRQASENIVRAAFEYSKRKKRQKVCAVHKANIMKMADGLFLEASRNVAADYPDIEYSEVIVDNMCMQLVMYPEKFDVVVTENLYGDILSDLAAGLVGGLGLIPSANIGKDCAIFEAVHGSAPDIAGKGIANPIALTLSAAMMLDYLGETTAASRVRTAVYRVLKAGIELTPDLGGKGTTKKLTGVVIDAL
ncbi:isocitrate/isopropylmalate dehydrogenase family protein [Anoxynatronum buryatiense]|uniref:Isocitrate/homoisocitrate dehydrogenase n=1 Tax=Anoxynatronum buryatiense TaxID=489973 RepID=A0AA45WUW0_9CLOT|nr:isocitrate/isopropylmalate family dehydrogenase [Anoxynatronum buryatiense]SMP48153.1 isocitrate dehydrogenase (NAD+) [Anoxynatronum buryatiense]